MIKLFLREYLFIRCNNFLNRQSLLNLNMYERSNICRIYLYLLLSKINNICIGLLKLIGILLRRYVHKINIYLT